MKHPASAEQLTRWVDHCEAQRQKPSTIARKLATLETVHALAGLSCHCSSQLVRDEMRGLNRRNGTVQPQAPVLRLGDEIGDVAISSFTVASLLEVCGTDLPGLRDAALISLAYDAGLRVSDLVAVTVEAVAVQDNGSEVLERRLEDGPRGAWGLCAAFPRDDAARWRLASGGRNSIRGPVSEKWIVRQKARPARRALAAADQGLVSLFDDDLQRVLDAVSTHSLRVGLTQDLFGNGEDSGPIAQALRWSSIGTALRYGRRLSPNSNAAARMLAERRK